jgi:hypothetical protein
MADYTTWTGLRAFLKEQEAVDIENMSRGSLTAMSYRLNDAIQAQFLPPIFTFLRLCNLHSRVTALIKSSSVEYEPAAWRR